MTKEELIEDWGLGGNRSSLYVSNIYWLTLDGWPNNLLVNLRLNISLLLLLIGPLPEPPSALSHWNTCIPTK